MTDGTNETRREQAADSAADGAQPTEPPTGAHAPPHRRRALRRVLLAGGPLAVLAAGGYVYLTTGRYVETENAYVKADKLAVSARVAGQIERVAVHENERVETGDVLFVLDDEPYRVALARAEAQLHAVRSMIESVKAQYAQQLEELQLARTDLAFTERELERQLSIDERDLGSEADVDRARHERDVATRRIAIVEQRLAQLRAQLGSSAGGGRLTDHSAYLAAKAARDAAALDLEHAVVEAPFDGIAGKVPTRGRHVAPGAAVMSLVADHDVWIEANYKETDLTRVEVGQPVRIRIDTYPDREWRGEVESIAQATGAEFSVIPPQNATGNWVKIAQRVPVRIAVDGGPEDRALRAGLSATVEIDTGHARRVPSFLRFVQRGLVDDASATSARRND